MAGTGTLFFDVFRSLALIKRLAVTDFRGAYSGSALGVVWAVVGYALCFGVSIGGFIGWDEAKFMLMGIESARSLMIRAALMQDRGDPEVRRFASMAKCYCSDTAMRVTTDAVQLMGGYGYMKDFPVERMMRDAKITQIFEGTNQIQRMIIAGEYLSTI